MSTIDVYGDCGLSSPSHRVAELCFFIDFERGPLASAMKALNACTDAEKNARALFEKSVLVSKLRKARAARTSTT
jgi:hypothetical protein